MKKQPKKNSERPRLSVDLAPHPDLVQMLSDAEMATGSNQSSIVIEALKEQLPNIVKMLREKRETAFGLFVTKYGGHDGAPPQDLSEHKDQLEGMKRKLKQ